MGGDRGPPHEKDDILVDMVGRRFVGSAPYWWGRLGGLVSRALYYADGEAGLRDVPRFADDFFLLCEERRFTNPICRCIL